MRSLRITPLGVLSLVLCLFIVLSFCGCGFTITTITLIPTSIPTPALTPTPTVISTIRPTIKPTPKIVVKPIKKVVAKKVIKKPIKKVTKPSPVQYTGNYNRVLMIDYYLTRPKPYRENSIFNANLACKAINGYVLNSSAIFSFNGVVGERLSSKGYKMAPLSSGKDGWGGGVCFISTGQYQAAKGAGLTILEHWNHTHAVNYATRGNEAAVDWYGGKDMRFQNNTNYKIQIECSMNVNILHIKIYKLVPAPVVKPTPIPTPKPIITPMPTTQPTIAPIDTPAPTIQPITPADTITHY